MSIISDNIANSSTVGYKAASASFSTLVTKQTSSTSYASGGVQCRTRSGIDAQGLLSTSTRTTDIAVSGNGFFITTTKANPSGDDVFSYTRAGSFEVDSNGYLKNANGYYLQAWSLQTYDGDENASLVQVGSNMFMKAYTDSTGSTVYVNDNIIDSNNLKPVNLNTIGGSAQETLNIRFGANLPADAPVYDSYNPEAGGHYSSAVLMYDSLGNSHNATLSFTKTGSGEWDVDMEMPSGAAALVSYCSGETTNDKEPDVYAARAQLEFNSIPTNHSTVAMETNGKNYVFEFTTDIVTYSPKANEVVIPVDLSSGIVTVSDAVSKFYEAITANLPGASRFYLNPNGTVVLAEQSAAGASVHFNASKCPAIAQSVANPDPETNIASGEFDLPEIDWDIKNCARLEFDSDLAADYVGKSVSIGNNTYLFATTDALTSNGVVTVNVSSAIDRSSGKIDTVKLVSLLKGRIFDTEPDFQRYVASGSTLEINPTSSGDPILVNSGNSTVITFQNTNLAAYLGQIITIGDTDNSLEKDFKFIDTVGVASGTVLADGSIAVNLKDLTELDTQETLPSAVMNALYNTIQTYYSKNTSIDNLSNYFRVSGPTIVSSSSFLAKTGAPSVVDGNTSTWKTTIHEQSLTFTRGNANDYVGKTVTVNGTTYTFTKFGVTNGTNIDITDAIYSQTIDFTGANPADGDTIVIGNYTYEFDNGSGVAAGNIAVAIGADETETVAHLATALGMGDPGGPALILTDNNIQSVDVSGCGAALTESVGADAVMSIFSSAIGKDAYQRGATMTLRLYGADPFAATTTDVPDPAVLVQEDLISKTEEAGVGTALSVVGKDNGKQSNQPVSSGLLVLNNSFYYNNVEAAQTGSRIAGVRFNPDGTPKEINVEKISIEWANGARDMTGAFYESSQLTLYLGDENTANGLTQLAGNYATNYITQDGAKFGNYTGVSVSEDGIVTAIFDNGETRPIAQIPLATFVDANSLESLNGNAWIETTASGYATLCTAGTSGAGVIAGGSLEDSTVDIAEEFTNMIQVQRAYSASSKIITTASDMLEELMNIKR